MEHLSVFVGESLVDVLLYSETFDSCANNPSEFTKRFLKSGKAFVRLLSYDWQIGSHVIEKNSFQTADNFEFISCSSG